MTPKERILATLRGEPTDTLPFVPRIDNWFYAQQAQGTLPDNLKNATLQEMVDELGIGYHSIIPNFKGWREGGYGDLHVGLGIYDLALTPWHVEIHNVGVSSERSPNGHLRVRYDTPKGTVTTEVVYTDEMRKNGITLYVITKHAMEDSDDYEAVSYIFENMEVVPDYDRYAEYRENVVGDRGVAVALSAMWASGGHYLIKELMGFEDFYAERMGDPDAMDEMAEKLQPACDRMFEAALNSPAEVILSGANYDFTFTTPDVVRDYVVPSLKEQSMRAHQKGKYVATHTDGDNTMLLPLYKQSGIDIADSICPAPMTKIPLKDTIDIFDHKITIWGGVPSTALVKDCTTDREFAAIVDQTLEDIGRGDHFIVSVADTLPAAADFERFMYLKKKIEEFGPVR
ncbi:MAG: hypothetical protein HFI88_10820 [Lachnospiraceae bacterium]|nr:hypothetical protein [Lachnospiraceae bacterium]